ncbi:MAG: hypothetical protein U5N86_00485 [Planctomycetota bacterium]|nr:hypothetical protein [Planctomycetota bacterium]
MSNKMTAVLSVAAIAIIAAICFASNVSSEQPDKSISERFHVLAGGKKLVCHEGKYYVFAFVDSQKAWKRLVCIDSEKEMIAADIELDESTLYLFTLRVCFPVRDGYFYFGG